MRECRRNVELFFLLNRLCPDFRTIADFRKRHGKLLKKIFLIFVQACQEMKLMDAKTLCLDGTTIRAVNGKKQATSAELSRKKLEYARAQLEAVEKYLDTLDENDLHEARIDHPFALNLDRDRLPDPKWLKERVAFHEKCLKELEETGRKSLTFTGPESAMMPAKEGGIKACYNVQTVVDAGSHMIVDFQVTDSPSDRGQISRSMALCKEELGLEAVSVVADKGYESAKDIRECLMNGVVADVGFIQDREERVFPLDYMEREITAEMKASAKPQDIQACLHAGVLPDRYENTNLRIQLQSLGPVSYRLPEAHPQDAKLWQMPLQMRPLLRRLHLPGAEASLLEDRHPRWECQYSCDSKTYPRRTACFGASMARRRVERHAWQDALDDVTALTKSEKGRRIYGWKKETIERSFVETKENHGLRHARMPGIRNMREQSLLTAAVQNIKRLVASHFSSLRMIDARSLASSALCQRAAHLECCSLLDNERSIVLKANGLSIE